MWFLISLCGYCILDFILGMTLGRCVLPGLKCKACKMGEHHGGE